MATIDIKHMHLFNNQVKMNSKTLMSSASDAKIQTKKTPQISLLLGGCRSGKSSYALDYTLGYGTKAQDRTVIATSKSRIDEITLKSLTLNNANEDNFNIFEEGNELAKIFTEVPSSSQIILIDSISVWIANLIREEKDTKQIRDEFIELLINTKEDVVIISNIVGLGIIPDNELERKFRDESGFFNQELAKIAHNVILMVAGIPTAIKGDLL